MARLAWWTAPFRSITFKSPHDRQAVVDRLHAGSRPGSDFDGFAFVPTTDSAFKRYLVPLPNGNADRLSLHFRMSRQCILDLLLDIGAGRPTPSSSAPVRPPPAVSSWSNWRRTTRFPRSAYTSGETSRVHRPLTCRSCSRRSSSQAAKAILCNLGSEQRPMLGRHARTHLRGAGAVD